MNLALWLARAGKSYPDRPAVGLGARVLRSYGELAGRVARLAGALTGRCGLRPGDRVAIAAKNSPDYLDLLYAIWHAGLAAVPANAKLHGAELGYILEHSGARACFASAGLDDEIAPHAPKSLERLIAIGGREYQQLLTTDPAAPVPRDSGDLAWLFYTSGTTGRPKGAMLTHRVLSVASHDERDPFVFYANPKPPVELYARGVEIDAAWLGGGTLRVTGNSFATPHVTGISALVLGKHPRLHPFQLKTVLLTTASNVGGGR